MRRSLVDVKPEGDGGHKQAYYRSPDVVCEGIDCESGDAAPVDDRQHCENPEGDFGRIDGGDKEECCYAGEDAECGVDFLRHVQFKGNNASDGDAVQGHDALCEEHEEEDDRYKQEDRNNEKQSNHTFPFSAALAGTDGTGEPDTGTISPCPDAVGNRKRLICACQIMLDKQVVVAFDGCFCVEQGGETVLLHVPDLRRVVVDALKNVPDVVLAKLHESPLDHVGGETGSGDDNLRAGPQLNLQDQFHDSINHVSVLRMGDLEICVADIVPNQFAERIDRGMPIPIVSHQGFKLGYDGIRYDMGFLCLTHFSVIPICLIHKRCRFLHF